MYIGLEVSLRSSTAIADFARCLIELGAPLESSIEIETAGAAVEFSLADATARA